MKTLLRILRFGVRYPWRAVNTLTLGVCGTLLVLALPEVTRRFVDEVIPNGQVERILPLAALGIGAIAMRQLITMLREWSNSAFQQKIVHDLRLELYRKIQRLPLRFFDRQPTGDIMNRVAADVPAMERVILGVLDQALSGFLQFAIVFGYLMALHPGLALLTVAPLPIVALSTWIYHRHAEPRYRSATEASSSLHSLLHDNIAGIRQIKAYTVEPEELERFAKRSAEVKSAQMKVIKANAFIWPLVSLIAESGILITIAFGAWWIARDQATLGDLSAVLMAWGFLYDPISRISSLTQLFTAGTVAGKRVFGILDLTDEPNLDRGDRPARTAGHVRYENVSFSYDETADRPTLSNINLEALPGQTIALVGPTGAGKSTLLNLLARFYEISSGNILLDGVPIQRLSKEWLRDHIGYVTQDSFLFNTTIRENLRLANDAATEGALWEALRASNADSFVKALPSGLDTLPGERGTRLSGGERQRLAIARALLKDPPILLLDEATSAVDNKTERLIQEALVNLRKNRTTFVIAHRLTTVRDADRIYVLKEGTIVEFGDHEALLQREGLYAKLLNARFGTARSSSDSLLDGDLQSREPDHFGSRPRS